MLEVGVSDDGSVLRGWMDECQAGISFTGCGAAPEVLTKESQDAVCFLCDGIDVMGPFKVVRVGVLDMGWQV